MSRGSSGRPISWNGRKGPSPCSGAFPGFQSQPRLLQLLLDVVAVQILYAENVCHLGAAYDVETIFEMGQQLFLGFHARAPR
jgi:hypothetical protein